MTDNSKPATIQSAGGHALARNTIWNLISYGVPLIVAVFTIPILIKRMGIDRFGILTLSWAVIGYFSLFDFGLGRALTRLVAEKIGTGKDDEVPAIMWTGLFLMFLLGIGGAAVAATLSPWLVLKVLKIPESLQHETLRSFYLISFSIPLVITTTGLRGFLEAHQRFDIIATVSVPMGVFTFLGPLIALVYSSDLFYMIAVLVLCRIIASVAYFQLCLKTAPVLRRTITFDRTIAVCLFSFGGWLTISSIVGPLMMYLDRFIIGALLSVTAVAYYTTPYDVLTRLLLIPFAFAGVLFPTFSAALINDRNHAARLFTRGVKYVFIILFPFILILNTFAREGLDLWLGAEFMQQSITVMQLLVIGVFINGLAHIPIIVILAAGRADVTAKLHLIELPLYLAAVWWLTLRFGIAGVAIVWVGRAVLDAVVLFFLADHIMHVSFSSRVSAVMLFILVILLFCVIGLLGSLLWKAILFSIMMSLFILITWFSLLDPDERMLLRNPWKLFSATN
jgi:O-antigen/teichoic acid export membrane protein